MLCFFFIASIRFIQWFHPTIFLIDLLSSFGESWLVQEETNWIIFWWHVLIESSGVGDRGLSFDLLCSFTSCSFCLLVHDSCVMQIAFVLLSIALDLKQLKHSTRHMAWHATGSFVPILLIHSSTVMSPWPIKLKSSHHLKYQ